MRRHLVILVIASALTAWFDGGREALQPGSARDDRRVILVVSDGLRWQDVFRGADSTILFAGGDRDVRTVAATRRLYWRPKLQERREALMPFLWGTVARQGTMVGNRDAGSRVDVANAMWFSYPGYNEMLTGRPDPRIDNNEFGPNPNVTVFEWLNEHDAFDGAVAAFGTWDTFRDIFNVGRSGLDVRTNGSEPHDALVRDQVLPFLRQAAPRALFVGFAETDDWGHEGRYDRYLDAVHAVDSYLAEIWAAVQADPRSRGRTTLIFTADHGRGRTAADWTGHGREVPGSGETFVVTLGADAGLLKAGRDRTLGEVASATAHAVGLRFTPRRTR